MVSTPKLLRRRAKLIQLLSQIEAAQLRAEWDGGEMPSSTFTEAAIERIDQELEDRGIDIDADQ